MERAHIFDGQSTWGHHFMWASTFNEEKGLSPQKGYTTTRYTQKQYFLRPEGNKVRRPL